MYVLLSHLITHMDVCSEGDVFINVAFAEHIFSCESSYPKNINKLINVLFPKMNYKKYIKKWMLKWKFQYEEGMEKVA